MSKNFELLTQIETEVGETVAARGLGLSRTSSVNEPLVVRNTPTIEQEVKSLVQKVFFPSSGVPCRQMVFCGIEAENPSSSVVARTGRILAAMAREKVCIVDANHGKDGVSGIYGVPPGLEAELGGSIVEACVPVAPRLYVLPWTPARGRRDLPPPEELRSALAELEREFGYILVDAPGCLDNYDATAWAQSAGAAILVVEAESSHRTAASKAKQKLEEAGARFAGTVLHNRSFPIPKALYDRL
jgi:hypothetical protein